MSHPEKEQGLAEVEAALRSEQVSRETLSRITAILALKVLDMVDFHHMDEDLEAGKADPKFVGPIKRSVAMASPGLFPEALRPLASSLKAEMLDLEAALVRNDLELAKAKSHEAHERYHQLQHGLAEWLGSGGVQTHGRTNQTLERNTALHDHGGLSHSQPTYTCTMHPEVKSNSPGSCPKCGMRLVPAK